MQSVAPSLSAAQEAIAKGRKAVIDADPSDQLVEHLKQYPSVHALIQQTMAHLPVVMDAASALVSSIDAAAIDEAANAHEKGAGIEALASARSPVSLDSLQAATARLRQAADVSSLLNALEAVANDPGVIEAANAWYRENGRGFDVNVVREALKKVDTNNLKVVTRIETASQALSNANAQLPGEAQQVLAFVQSELEDITSKAKRDVDRFLELVDMLLTRAFA